MNNCTPAVRAAAKTNSAGTDQQMINLDIAPIPISTKLFASTYSFLSCLSSLSSSLADPDSTD